MSKHTTGRWQMFPRSKGEDYTEIIPDNCDYGDAVAVYGRTQEANAKRIVACVNALEGIEDPEAFMAAVDDLSKEVGLSGLHPNTPTGRALFRLCELFEV